MIRYSSSTAGADPLASGPFKLAGLTDGGIAVAWTEQDTPNGNYETYSMVYSPDANCTVPAGTNGNDTIFGCAGDDSILGLDGNDHIVGDAGNDTITGGRGNDTIYGASGDDYIINDNGHAL